MQSGALRHVPGKPPPEDEDAEILSVARKNFGFQRLSSGQSQAIRSLLSKHDTLVVMPTGSGKSAIYQIAGLMLPRSVLLVSPLITLQKDQADSINANGGNVEAWVVNSSLRPVELRETLDRVSSGAYKFVFSLPSSFVRTRPSMP